MGCFGWRARTADEDADPDAAHVEFVKELVDRRHVAELEVAALALHHRLSQLEDASGHCDERRRVAIIDLVEEVVKFGLGLRVDGRS